MRKQINRLGRSPQASETNSLVCPKKSKANMVKAQVPELLDVKQDADDHDPGRGNAHGKAPTTKTGKTVGKELLCRDCREPSAESVPAPKPALASYNIGNKFDEHD